MMRGKKLKQFIVLVAVFLLFIPVFMQISAENVNFAKKSAVEYFVSNAKEEAKQEGFYTEEILKELKSNIAEKLNINANRIVIDPSTTKTVKYRLNEYDIRGRIFIRISVPFDNVIAAGDFLSIDKDGYYVIEEVTFSEKLR